MRRLLLRLRSMLRRRTLRKAPQGLPRQVPVVKIAAGTFSKDSASFTPETDEQCFWCSKQADYIVAYGCTQLHIHGLAACKNCWANLQPQWAKAKCPVCDCAIWDWGTADRQGNTQTSW